MLISSGMILFRFFLPNQLLLEMTEIRWENLRLYVIGADPHIDCFFLPRLSVIRVNWHDFAERCCQTLMLCQSIKYRSCGFCGSLAVSFEKYGEFSEVHLLCTVLWFICFICACNWPFQFRSHRCNFFSHFLFFRSLAEFTVDWPLSILQPFLV